MIRKGIPASPARFAISWIGHLRIISQRLLMQPRVRRCNKSFEQRMRLVRLAVEFRVELAGNEKWMLRQFNHLDQFAVRRQAAKYKAAFLKPLAVGVVELVTVAMPFL